MEAGIRQIPEGATEEDILFLDWLTSNGATFPKLRWPVYSWPRQPHDGERGVLAVEDIQPGEQMFSIPGSILMNREKCLASAIGSVFKQHRTELFSDRDELALSLFLLYEKLEHGPKSFWWPMIQALPKDPGSAALWGESELALLQDDALRAEALLKVRSIADTYRRVILPIVQAHTDHFTPHKYTLQEFRWAILCVESRTFGRFLPNPSITPFADLLNHVNVHTSYRWDPSAQCAVYMCDASGRFKHSAGQEAYMSYGPRSNRELLLHYGFSLQDNEHDTCSIQFRVARNVGGKRSLRTLQVELRHRRPCMLALALFRWIVGTHIPQVANVKVSPDALQQGAFVRYDEERRALEMLKDAYMQVLKVCFDTDHEQDLASMSLQNDLRKRFAVIYRLGRKELILSQIAFLDAAIKELDVRTSQTTAESDGFLMVDCSYLEAAFTDFTNGTRQADKDSIREGVSEHEAHDDDDDNEGRQGVDRGSSQGMQTHGRTLSGEDLCDIVLQEARSARREQDPPLELSEHVTVALPPNFVAKTVTCGSYCTAFVSEDGQLLTVGNNQMAKLGHSRTEFDVTPHCVLPTKVMPLSSEHVEQVACGAEHMAVLTHGGGVWCWGANTNAQCGLGHRCTQVLQPTRVGNAPGSIPFTACAVVCGHEFTMALSISGEAFAWGRNHEGQCGIGATKGTSGCVHVPSLVKVPSASSGGFSQVCAGARQACGVDKRGKLWSWGCAVGGSLGVGAIHELPQDADGDAHCPSPAAAVFERSADRVVSHAYIAHDGITLVDSEGDLYFTGGHPIAGSEYASSDSFCKLSSCPSPEATCCALSVWPGHIALLFSDHSLHIAASVHDVTRQPSWHVASHRTGVAHVAAGDTHHCIVLNDGEVLSTGRFEFGECGVPLGIGFMSGVLQQRLTHTLVNVAQTSHPGVCCSVCRCEPIKSIGDFNVQIVETFMRSPMRHPVPSHAERMCMGYVQQRTSLVDQRVIVEGGVRFASSSPSNVDVCSGCIKSALGTHAASQNALLVCHRRLPKNFRPALPPLATDQNVRDAGHMVSCDSCAAVIGEGVRYMCGNCTTYNLCRTCHDKPTQVRHASSHLFIMLAAPLLEDCAQQRPFLPNIFPQLAADVYVQA